MASEDANVLRVPAREIPVPTSISPAAQAYLTPRPAPAADFPPLGDKAAWRAHIAATEDSLRPLLEQISPAGATTVEERDFDGARVFDITPAEASSSPIVVLD